MNKKTIMIIGGAVAAYLIWDKFIKKDEDTVIAPVEGEGTSGVDGKYLGDSIVGRNCYCGQREGTVIAKDAADCKRKCASLSTNGGNGGFGRKRMMSARREF